VKPKDSVENRLIALAKKLFGCDTARLSKPLGKMFLIVGYAKSTKTSGGTWIRHDGERIDFDYTEEKCIASGVTVKELAHCMRRYKKLEGLNCLEAIEKGLL
jgi:hypothetical protein